MSAEFLTALASFATVIASILGPAVGWLFVQLRRIAQARTLEAEAARERELLCDQRAEILRRRVILLWNAILTASSASGVPVDANLAPAMLALDTEERDITSKVERPRAGPSP